MKKTLLFLCFTSFSIFNLLAEAVNCFPDLPDPIVRVQDIIIEDFGNGSSIEYTFPIFNVADYPAEMFGLLPESTDSRMAVELYDSNDNLLTTIVGLDQSLLLFSFLQLSSAECPPTELLYVQIVDRLCDIRYTSNLFNAWSCQDPDAHNYLDPNPTDCGCETCFDGIQNGDETGVDCGGSNCPECPELACRNVDVYVNLNEPDYQSSYFNRIWLKNAFSFIDFENTSLPDGFYNASIRRRENFINFDWTTQGAGFDGNPNGIINNNDKGKSFRSCLPLSFFDIWRVQKYRLKLQQEAINIDGSNGPAYFCNGTYRTLMTTPGQNVLECIGVGTVLIGTSDTVFYSAPLVHYTPISDSDPAILSTDSMIDTPTESSIEALYLKGGSGFTDLVASPNPGNNMINLKWNSQTDELVQVVITDSMGRLLSANQVYGKRGHNELILDAEHLSPGLHFITVRTKSYRNTVRWVKVN